MQDGSIFLDLIIIKLKEGSIIGKMGWAVNSIAIRLYEFDSLAS